MADTPAHHYDPYDSLAPVYDWMAKALLLPFGGEARFRNRALSVMHLDTDHRVLELGCGTGTMTRLMSQTGAQVTALDLAKPMLAKARLKAPSARVLEEDILAWRDPEPYDRALLCFVLHEMTPEIRAGALETARANLAPNGLLVIIDFAGDASFPVDPVFRAYLSVAEPEVAADVLDGLPAEVEAAGFEIVEQRRLALGTARSFAARPLAR